MGSGKITIYQSIILYRKFFADSIFNGNNLLQNHVLITDTHGLVLDLIDEKEAGDGIEKMEGLLCPGFINAHCHLELSHMKGCIPQKTGLVDFVLKVMSERHVSEDEILSAINNAENEMLANGIVAVGDICNNTLTIPQKKQNKLRYHNFIEVSGFSPSIANLRFEKAISIATEYENILPNQRTTINPHAPYSVSGNLFALINELQGNELITIHNQETSDENKFFEYRTGQFIELYQQLGIDISFFKPSKKTSLQTWLPYFTNRQSIILVHNVSTGLDDIEMLNFYNSQKNLSAFFCLCPNANLYITGLLPEVKRLIKEDCKIVLGTDSLASNSQLSILKEMETLQNNFEDIELGTLLQWATFNGAMALKMDKMLGSFEKGKTPGVILINGINKMKLSKDSTIKRIL